MAAGSPAAWAGCSADADRGPVEGRGAAARRSPAPDGGDVVTRLCEDCGAHAEWHLSSVRENAVPPDVVETGACHEHRLDATENLLHQYGNVTVAETLG